MSEEIEIILKAIDNASDTFDTVSSNAEEIGSAVEGAASEATSGFEEIDSSATESGEAIEDVAGSIDGIDSSSIDDAAQSSDDLADSGDEASDSMDGLASAFELIAAGALVETLQSAAEELWNLADKAGTVQDSVNRATLEAEGFGISAEQMTATVSELSNVTGRTGGQIREAFITATSMGITNLDSFKIMMQGASGQAYLLNTDLETMANKYSSLAMKSKVAERTLKGTGITIEDLGDAMGMHGATLDEINAKWETLDTNARAAILGQAASMKEGETANEAFKNSWEGLLAQIDRAKGKIEVIAGQVILPILVPILEIAASALESFAGAFGQLMSSPIGGFVSILAAVAIGIGGLVVAMAAGAAAMDFFAVSIQPAIAASWELIAPWVPFIAIGAAIVGIIYAIGAAFGWWSDIGGMIDAIGAGLQRLWSAFINHPDVQAAIQFISDALAKLWAAVQKAGQAVLEFFGISAGSNWDIVRAIIDGIGWAWNGLKSILGPIIGIVLQVWNAFNDLMASLGPVGDMLVLLFVPGGLIIEMFRLLTDVINGNTERWGWLGTVLGVIVGILRWVYNGIVWLIGGLTQLWNTFSQSSEVQGTLSWLVDSWNWLTEAVNGTIQAVFDFLGAVTGTNLGEATNLLEGLQLIWENLQEPIRMVGQFISDLGTAIWNVITGQQDLLSAATDVWNSLLTNISPLIQAIVQIVINFAYQLALWAYQAGMNFVLNIINYIRTLPSQVMNWLNQTGTNVNTGMQRWITTAISKASSMVSNILSYIRTLPSRILALLLQVLASIRSAGSQWVSAARSKASELVNSAASTIAQLPGRVRSALAGLVEAVVAPFRNAYNTAKYWVDRINSLVIKDPKTKGGYDLPASQEIDLFGNWGADYYTTSENTVTVKGGADLNINLTGLPSGVDEETVAEIVLQSIQSDSTIERLVSNPLFQSLDAKMKGKTQRRVNRSRGV